ncbi:hypothetical protein TRVL_10346 [Trypanosoma vivax]|nr:hypothetical protein TRVL_10346 [Trypanosoma vivax]
MSANVTNKPELSIVYLSGKLHWCLGQLNSLPKMRGKVARCGARISWQKGAAKPGTSRLGVPRFTEEAKGNCVTLTITKQHKEQQEVDGDRLKEGKPIGAIT